MTTSLSQLAKAHRTCKQFFEMLSLDINADKSFVLSTSTTLTEEQLRHVDIPYGIATQEDLLGADIAWRQAQPAGRAAQRWKKAKERTARLKMIPGSYKYKSKLAQAMISSLWSYLPIGPQPPVLEQNELHKSLLTALWPKRPPEAAVEVLFNLAAGHALHPGWSTLYNLLAVHHRAVQDDLPMGKRLWASAEIAGDETMVGRIREAAKRLKIAMSQTGLCDDDHHLEVVRGQSRGELLHDCRAFARRVETKRLARRRPKQFGELSERHQ